VVKKTDIFNEVIGDFHIAEQGSREYLEKTIQDMARSSDPIKTAYSKKIN